MALIEKIREYAFALTYLKSRFTFSFKCVIDRAESDGYPVPSNENY